MQLLASPAGLNSLLNVRDRRVLNTIAATVAYKEGMDANAMTDVRKKRMTSVKINPEEALFKLSQ